MSSFPKEAFESLTRTVRQTLMFKGRSPARDAGYFWICVMLLADAVEAASRLLPWDAAVIGRLCAQSFLCLPIFALFARRLHDHNWSGWWALMLPPLVAFNAYRTVQVTFALLDPNWPNMPDAGAWASLLAPVVILSMVIMFLPGTIGANRFGPDPREGAHGAHRAPAVE